MTDLERMYRQLVRTVRASFPQYLTQPLVRSTHFKKLPDGASTAWTPEACSAR